MKCPYGHMQLIDSEAIMKYILKNFKISITKMQTAQKFRSIEQNHRVAHS